MALPIDITKFEHLKASGDLPSPKGVALAIIRLIQQDDSSMGDLARIIKTDPAFVGRLIKAQLDSVESVARVVGEFFKRVGVEIKQVIDYLASLLDWSEVLTNQRAFQQMVSDGMNNLVTQLTTRRAELGRNLQNVQSLLADYAAGRVGPSQLPPPPPPDGRSGLASIGGHFGYLFDKLASSLSFLDVPTGLPLDALPSTSDALKQSLLVFATKLQSSQLGAAVRDPKTFVGLGIDGLLNLVFPLAGSAIGAMAPALDFGADADEGE